MDEIIAECALVCQDRLSRHNSVCVVLLHSFNLFCVVCAGWAASGQQWTELFKRENRCDLNQTKLQISINRRHDTTV